MGLHRAAHLSSIQHLSAQPLGGGLHHWTQHCCCCRARQVQANWVQGPRRPSLAYSPGKPVGNGVGTGKRCGRPMGLWSSRHRPLACCRQWPIHTPHAPRWRSHTSRQSSLDPSPQHASTSPRGAPRLSAQWTPPRICGPKSSLRGLLQPLHCRSTQSPELSPDGPNRAAPRTPSPRHAGVHPWMPPLAVPTQSCRPSQRSSPQHQGPSARGPARSPEPSSACRHRQPSSAPTQCPLGLPAPHPPMQNRRDAAHLTPFPSEPLPMSWRPPTCSPPPPWRHLLCLCPHGMSKRRPHTGPRPTSPLGRLQAPFHLPGRRPSHRLKCPPNHPQHRSTGWLPQVLKPS
mmetsp:Transcript_117432/g.204511  ORF Transcript_117432/g.204511 Transcript_117432/m.204511 type:complete len:344 (+) Transcript_117432:921-1952(+)